MKNIFLLILLPVCLFFSCGGNRTASEMMDRAEIFLETNPDSAYTLLNNVSSMKIIKRGSVDYHKLVQD